MSHQTPTRAGEGSGEWVDVDSDPSDGPITNDLSLLLPDEIWEWIFRYLDQKDLPNTALVCSRFAMLCCSHVRARVTITDPKYMTAAVFDRLAWHYPRQLIYQKSNIFRKEKVPQQLYLHKVSTIETLQSQWTFGGSSLAEVIKSAPQLRHLILLDAEHISNVAVVRLSALHRLESLDLRPCLGMSGRGVSHLTNLRRLSLDWGGGCPAETMDWPMTALTSLSRLTDLRLRSCAISEPGMKCLSSALVGLKTLHFGWCKLTDSILSYLCAYSNLHRLNISYVNRVTDVGVANLNNISSLRSLFLWGNASLTDSGLAELSGLTNLRKLSVQGCDHSHGTSLTHLTALTQLTSLDLRSCGLEPAGLLSLAAFPLLRDLDIGRSCLKDVALEVLTNIHQLRSLSLRNSQNISDVGLAHLGKLSQLTHLDIGYCYGIPDQGLRTLVEVEALPQCLRKLELHGCIGIGRETVHALTTLIPDLRVDLDAEWLERVEGGEKDERDLVWCE